MLYSNHCLSQHTRLARTRPANLLGMPFMSAITKDEDIATLVVSAVVRALSAFKHPKPFLQPQADLE